MQFKFVSATVKKEGERQRNFFYQRFSLFPFLHSTLGEFFFEADIMGNLTARLPKFEGSVRAMMEARF